MYIPDKGDIVLLDFDPSAGNKIMKRRPAFVISREAFNQHTGFTIVAPITSTARGMKLEVILPNGLATVGTVLIHQLKSVDVENRKIELVEKSPLALIKTVTALAEVIIQ